MGRLGQRYFIKLNGEYMRAMILFLLLVLGFTSYAEIIVPADIVEGQDSQKNFLGRVSHFEKNANGVVAYADAAASRPVDGTGGTPSLTCTRTTTTPIEGDGSLLITKGAVNDQGEGCAIAFTIPNNQKAKVLQIEMDYIVASGTFSAGSTTADSDLIVYIYDVTNSTLIEPSSIKFLSNSTTISDKFVANFQTSATGTSYRLILHQATTSASAYTVEFDNLQVKPSRYVYGTPITDWVSYTPTTGLTTNTSNLSGHWRRVGDSMQINARFELVGTPAAGSSTISLPSGYVIDTTKLPASTNSVNEGNSTFFGSGIWEDSGVGYKSLNVAYNTTTSIIIHDTESGSSSALTAAKLASGDSVGISFQVPISGWSSSTQVSDGWDGRSIYATVSASGAVSVSTAAKIAFNTVTKDSTNSFSTANNRFTAPSGGTYIFDGVINYGASGALTTTIVYLYKNGSSIRQVTLGVPSGASFGIPFSFQDDAVATDYYEIFAQNSTAATTSAGNSYWNIKKLSSPTTISATEVVAAKYTGTTTGSIGPAANVTTYPTRVFDTHNAYSGGAYTAPVSGLYHITASNDITGTEALNSETTLLVTVDGSTNSYLASLRSPGTVTNTAISGSALVQVNAGQLIRIALYTDIGTPAYTSNTIVPSFSIHRIK